jgi:hypothetical protein
LPGGCLGELDRDSACLRAFQILMALVEKPVI